MIVVCINPIKKCRCRNGKDEGAGFYDMEDSYERL
jgi:hypothetical protein